MHRGGHAFDMSAMHRGWLEQQRQEEAAEQQMRANARSDAGPSGDRYSVQLHQYVQDQRRISYAAPESKTTSAAHAGAQVDDPPSFSSTWVAPQDMLRALFGLPGSAEPTRAAPTTTIDTATLMDVLQASPRLSLSAAPQASAAATADSMAAGFAVCAQRTPRVLDCRWQRSRDAGTGAGYVIYMYALQFAPRQVVWQDRDPSQSYRHVGVLFPSLVPGLVDVPLLLADQSTGQSLGRASLMFVRSMTASESQLHQLKLFHTASFGLQRAAPGAKLEEEVDDTDPACYVVPLLSSSASPVSVHSETADRYATVV